MRVELERRATAADRTVSQEVARAIREYLAKSDEEER
jgi:hypothetical protein